MASIPCPINRQCQLTPDSIAIYHPDNPLSWRELEQRVVTTSASIHTLPDNWLAVLSKDPIQQIVLLFSCLRAGKVFAPLCPDYPLSELSRRCQQAGISYYYQDIKANVPALDEFSVKSSPINQRATNTAKLSLHQSATLVFTSGSSGSPKAVQHSLANHYYSARGSQTVIPFTTRHCWLLSLPLYHIAGIALVMRAFLAGGSIAIVPGDPLQGLMTYPITHASLVPTQLHRLLSEREKVNQSQLQYLLIGGAALPISLTDSLMQLTAKVYVSYGMTEMSSQIATARLNPLSQYQVLPEREVKIEHTEVLVKGKTLFQGYLEKGLLSRPLNQGWFATRDTGELLGNHLRIRGRIDNMFVSGGENVQPEVVESVLLKYPGISQAIVVPIEDNYWGQRGVAFLQWQEEAKEEALRRWLETRLAPWQKPVYFLKLPNSSGLKHNRKELAELAKKIP